MRFETVAVAEAEGAILAHGIRTPERLLKKGRVLTKEDLAQLARAGVSEVIAARLDAEDVAEDVAAARIAQALAGDGVRLGAAFTGRANLYAPAPGLVQVDGATIDAANRVHEAITIATLPVLAPADADDMVATVKIIPYAAPAKAVETVCDIVGRQPIALAPFRPKRVGLVGTFLPGQKASLRNKTRAALEARLAPLGGQLVFETHCAHQTGAIADAIAQASASGAELLFVFGASAISDRRDVVPAGIVAAGGSIEHFGMPVDPGNLLLLARLGGKPVIGLPGCARSPKLNGFDFVLQRLMADIEVRADDIMQMGVGGLLKEIPSRPQPREEQDASALRAPRIAAIVLAAGLSRRMGRNKLIERVGDVPILRRTVETALAAPARPVIVVTGHQHDQVEAALAGLDVRFVRNGHPSEGISSSLRIGLQAVPGNADGALVLLGDMPEVASALLDRMIAAFSPADGRAICVATHRGKRGNPVLFARRYFAEIEAITGDTGAKHVIGLYEDAVCEVEADASVLHDVDTPEALEALRKRASVSA